MLGDIDLSEVPINDGVSTTSEGDESSIDGGIRGGQFDDFR